MITLQEYRDEMEKTIAPYGKMAKGVKYVKKWDWFLLEKQYLIDQVDLNGIKTALDVGTGVGMLAYLLMQKGLHVEGSDIDEAETGTLFKECCDVISLKRR